MLELGKKLRNLRHDRNWSQEDVAKRLDISIAAYSKMETDVTDLNTSRLEQLAGIFEMSLAELILDGEDLAGRPTDELKTLRETVNKQMLKIVELQEYVISLYEQLHQVRKS